MTKELLIVLLLIAALFSVVKWWPYQEGEMAPPQEATLSVTPLVEDGAAQ